MIRDAKTNKIIEIVLWCINCKAWTLHKREDDHVACSCGSETDYTERMAMDGKKE